MEIEVSYEWLVCGPPTLSELSEELGKQFLDGVEPPTEGEVTND